MALGILTLQGFSPSPTGPEKSGPYLMERWQYLNADATRTNDKITAKYISRIIYITGYNQDNYGASAPYTIDNTVFPPTVALANVTTGEGGNITLYGY